MPQLPSDHEARLGNQLQINSMPRVAAWLDCPLLPQDLMCAYAGNRGRFLMSYAGDGGLGRVVFT
jgi:hypothetical protein